MILHPGATLPESFETNWPISSEMFDAAVGQMHACSCCGQGRGRVVAVAGPARPHPMAALGYAAWRETIRPAPPIVPAEREPFILPALTVVEPGRPSRQGQDVWIADGRIARVVPAGAVAPGPARVLEALRGQVVAPALTDMHVHLPPANALRLTRLFLLLTLRHGVARVREAGDADGTATPAALALVKSGALPGPDIRYCYNFVTAGVARWVNSLQMAVPDQARAIVDHHVHTGASWIKSYENLDAPRIAALVDAATDAGLQVMGHVPTALKIEASGLPDAQHYFGVADPAQLRRDHVLNRAIDWASVTPARIAEVAGAYQRSGRAMTPTLSTSANLLRLARWKTARHDPDVRLLPRLFAEVIWHPRHGIPAYRDIAPADFDRARDAFDKKLALTATLASAGVPLRLGTDTQQPFVVPGSALHAEIAMFEQAGIAREVAWGMASAEAGQVLGVDQAGRIEEGAPADLVVSPASPFAPGWAVASLTAVVAGGACLLTRDLDKAIRREQGRFENALSDHITRWLTRVALNKVARNFVG